MYHSLISSLHSAVLSIFMYSVAGMKLSMMRCFNQISFVSSQIQSIRFSHSQLISVSMSAFSEIVCLYLLQILLYSFFLPAISLCWEVYFFWRSIFSSSFCYNSCWIKSCSLHHSSISAFFCCKSISCCIASFIYSVPWMTFSSMFLSLIKSFSCFFQTFSFSSYSLFNSSKSFAFSASAMFAASSFLISSSCFFWIINFSLASRFSSFAIFSLSST